MPWEGAADTRGSLATEAGWEGCGGNQGMPMPAAARGWEGLGGSRALGHLDLQTRASTKFCCFRPRSWGASRKCTRPTPRMPTPTLTWL